MVKYSFLMRLLRWWTNYNSVRNIRILTGGTLVHRNDLQIYHGTPYFNLWMNDVKYVSRLNFCIVFHVYNNNSKMKSMVSGYITTSSKVIQVLPDVSEFIVLKEQVKRYKGNNCKLMRKYHLIGVDIQSSNYFSP